MPDIVQKPIAPTVDLRDMLRQHIIARSLDYMRQAEQRRQTALRDGDIAAYQQAIQTAVQGFYGKLPVGRNSPRPQVTAVSRFDKAGYRLENVLFDSFPGWQVNATVYVPLDYAPPFPAVVIPVGHSGKQFESYQLPAQFFARSGYLAVLFDPPGQASEKRPGNDHFVDGVRCYLVGTDQGRPATSSQYFVADAVRCIDYLETRADVDLSRGVAMTGVSGGGTTTTLAVHLDERITVIGPSCCLSPLSDLDITQCYANCPETHVWERYVQGIDEVDLLCAVAGATPTDSRPTLLMAGELDEVFHVEDTAQLADQVRAFYQRAGAADRFEFFIDRDRGHCYSLDQARQFTAFMNRWLLGQPDRPVCDWPDAAFTLDPYEQMRCYPRLDVHMRSLTLDRAKTLESARTQDASRMRAAAGEIAGVQHQLPAPTAQVSEPLQVWTHDWRQALLSPEPGIQIPATIVQARNKPTATILHLDDQHRNRLLYRNGLLSRVIGFMADQGPVCNYLGVDLRGWGDTYPAMYPFEMAGWATVERTLAYKSNALGDPLMAMRIRDGLSALAFLRSRPALAEAPIILTGSGLGGLTALHVAAIDGQVAGVIVWDSLVSFRSILETEQYSWPADTFIPGILVHYDIPELVRAVGQILSDGRDASALCPVAAFDPRDGQGHVLSEAAVHDLNAQVGRELYHLGAEAQTLSETIREMVRTG